MLRSSHRVAVFGMIGLLAIAAAAPGEAIEAQPARKAIVIGIDGVPRARVSPWPVRAKRATIQAF